MKRFFALALVLCLLVPSLVFAESTEKEWAISFRNIPWGSNIPTVRDLFAADNVSFGQAKLCGTNGDRNYYIYDNGKFPYKDVGCYMYNSSSSQPLKVAGYEVDTVYCYFAFTPDETGIIVNDINNTAFIMGQYEIEPVDTKTAMDDLLNKLTKVYGKYSDYKERNSSIKTTTYVWVADDNSCVSLRSKVYSSGSHYIYITYTYPGFEEYFDAAMAARAYEEALKVDKDDTSGL